MWRTSALLSFVATALLFVAADGQQPAPRRSKAPMLTSEDVLSPLPATSVAEPRVSGTGLSGSPLRNPRIVLENALIKMGEVNSVRTRLQTSMPGGDREVLIESMKPDRVHVTSPYGEMIGIGRKFYIKSAGTWQVTSAPASAVKSDAGFDYRTFVKQMTGKAGVRITGQKLGGETIDGVEAIVYEFAVTDGAETGTIQLCVGKDDGYIRRMALSGGAVGIRMWFTSINEDISIEPPM